MIPKRAYILQTPTAKVTNKELRKRGKSNREGHGHASTAESEEMGKNCSEQTP